MINSGNNSNFENNTYYRTKENALKDAIQHETESVVHTKSHIDIQSELLIAQQSSKQIETL